MKKPTKEEWMLATEKADLPKAHVALMYNLYPSIIKVINKLDSEYTIKRPEDAT